MASTQSSPLSHLVNVPISKLAPFSGLILTVTAVAVYLVRIYLIEKWLMQTRAYRKKYEILNETQKRSLVNHHVSVLLKILLVAISAYPFLQIFCARSSFQQLIDGDTSEEILVSVGDLLIISSNIFTTMYVFELFYRSSVSIISGAHHVGAIIIAQTAIAITFNVAREKDAVYEFAMCLVWGAFDVLAELWPHLAMIMYRLRPDRHHLLARILLGVAYLELLSTVAETGLVFWLWGSLWTRWTLVFKIVTPILHTLFTLAQLWGFWVLRQLSHKEYRKLEQQNIELRISTGRDNPP